MSSNRQVASRRLLYMASALSIHTVRWVNAMARNRLDVHLLSLDSPTEPIDPRVTLHFPPFRRQPGYIANSLWSRRLIRQLMPALVHSHYASGYGTLAALCGFHPTILSVWGSDVYEFPYRSPLHRWLLKFNLSRADRVLSTSHAMAIQTQRFTDKQITVTPFGVDLENFRPLPVRSLFSSGDIVVGTVKTLEVNYGIEYLIRAFRLLKDMLPATPLKLLIVGGGSQRARLESLARELGVWADTRFTGHVGHDEVPQYFNMLDIAVMPSIFESFGVSAIEANACCKPVVVCDVGGLPEVVEDGVTGLVVESRNEVAIATAIGRLVAEPGLRSKMGQAGRERVGKLYEWNANVEQMLSIYDEVAGSVPVGMPA